MNIKKYIGKSWLSIIIPMIGVAGFTSCSDWDDHYEGDAASGTDISLWDAIQQRSDLSDFAQVLENTMVFRQHRKTSVSYADVLKGGRSLTLFAPVNGSFNKDSLLSLVVTASGDSAVERFFVLNHLSQNLVSADGTDKKFLLLNNKNIRFNGDVVGSVALKERNIHSKNGILHVMSSQMPYMYTIYEALANMPEFESNGKFLSSYNQDEFNENASVSSGIVDGKKVYVDSVMTPRNKLMERIGLLNAEDSTYHVVVPTEAGWNKAWKKAMDAFVFPKNNPKADSLQRLYAYRALMDNAIFSQTVQASIQDSVRSQFYNKLHPQYGVFYKPFDNNGIFGKAKNKITCSNGYLYATDEWVFDPAMTYHKTIEIEGETTSLITNYKLCSYIPFVLPNFPFVSKGEVLDIEPETGRSNWSITFKVQNVVSGEYDIKLAALPKAILGWDSELPCRFTATINYIDENGNEQQYQCKDGQPFETDPFNYGYINLARFKFPACNYDQQSGQASITLTCSIKSSENMYYDRELLLDNIIFEPVKEK